jgi:beta-1,4-mannosyltransferase
MQKTRVYIYPFTTYHLSEGSNQYIVKLRAEINRHHVISNSNPTSLGLLDLLFKFFKTDVFYFNWIEDLPNKRGGRVQTIVLFLFLKIISYSKKKIIWFVHNRQSHSNESFYTKKIRKWLKKSSDIILTHSKELEDSSDVRIKAICHPFELTKRESDLKRDKKWDILIWGNVSRYKGILEFLQFASQSKELKQYKILIAGKFNNTEYLNEVLKYATINMTIRNEIIKDNELPHLIDSAKFTLFTYISNSVLSSGALNFTLPMDTKIIGPNLGDFKQFGEMGFIQTFETFNDIPKIMTTDFANSSDKLLTFIKSNDWRIFGNQISSIISNLAD